LHRRACLDQQSQYKKVVVRTEWFLPRQAGTVNQTARLAVPHHPSILAMDSEEKPPLFSSNNLNHFSVSLRDKIRIRGECDTDLTDEMSAEGKHSCPMSRVFDALAISMPDALLLCEEQARCVPLNFKQ
jgi:hypothetical protein